MMFGGSLDGVREDTLTLLAQVMPVVEIPRAELAAGIGIVDLLSRTVAESKSAARRLVAAGRRVREQRPHIRRRAQGLGRRPRDADDARRARRPEGLSARARNGLSFPASDCRARAR